MRKIVFFLALAGLVGIAPAVMAATAKVGVVDAGYILEHSTAGQAAMKKLQAYGNKERQGLEASQKQLKAEQESLKKNAGIASKTAQEAATKKFQANVKAFQSRYQKTQEAFSKERQELLQPLQAKLYNVIRQYAKRHAYTLVLDKRAAIYNAKGTDLTQQILKAFNASSKP